jgi:hypothetical protein
VGFSPGSGEETAKNAAITLTLPSTGYKFYAKIGNSQVPISGGEHTINYSNSSGASGLLRAVASPGGMDFYVETAPGTTLSAGEIKIHATGELEDNRGAFTEDATKTLLPVEILIPEFKKGSDGYWSPTNKLIATNKLAIGTLEDSFELGNAKPLKADWIEADPDRFYIRTVNPAWAGKGTIKARVWTSCRTNIYDDDDRSTPDSEVVDLTEEGNTGVFKSKSMLLTSNDGDDQTKTPHTTPQGNVVDVLDNAKNDRTRKIRLGGKLRVEILEGKPAATYNADIEAEVAIEKTVKIKVFVATIGGVQVTSDADIDTDLKVLQETMAQVGVKIVRSDPVVKFNHADAGINLSNGLTVNIPNVQEAGPLFNWVSPQRAADEISYIYVNRINDFDGGLAFRQADFPTAPNYVGHVLMGQDKRGRYIVAHEILHILLNAVHDTIFGPLHYSQEFYHRRMTWGGGPEDIGIEGRKRISKYTRGMQKEGIISSSYAK